MALVVGLAVSAAFLFAYAAVSQQHATLEMLDSDQGRTEGRRNETLPVVRGMKFLVRNKLWLLGWVTNLGGFLTQAMALHLGSVALVQPVLVLQLLFTLPLMAIWTQRRPLLRDFLAGGLICGGLALFLAIRGAAPDQGAADRPAILVAALAVVVVAGVLSVSGHTPNSKAVTNGIAAGLFFALSAVLTTLTTADLFDRGIPATAVDWPGYALAGSTPAGLLLEHESFGAGPLPLSISAMTVTNPVASYLIGILAFDVKLPTSAPALAAVTGSAALIAGGVVWLAHSPTVRRESKNIATSAATQAHAVSHSLNGSVTSNQTR